MLPRRYTYNFGTMCTRLSGLSVLTAGGLKYINGSRVDPFTSIRRVPKLLSPTLVGIVVSASAHSTSLFSRWKVWWSVFNKTKYSSMMSSRLFAFRPNRRWRIPSLVGKNSESDLRRQRYLQHASWGLLIPGSPCLDDPRAVRSVCSLYESVYSSVNS